MPVMDVMLSMLAFFAFVAWFWVLILVLSDIFRNRDMGGGSKALWVMFVILMPWLGVVVYLIVHGDGMYGRRLQSGF